MSGGGGQRGDHHVGDVGFALFDEDVAVHDLHLAGTQTLDLPTLQGDPGLEAILDEIVVARLFVGDDGAGTGAFYCFALLCHRTAL